MNSFEKKLVKYQQLVFETPWFQSKYQTILKFVLKAIAKDVPNR